MTENTDNRSLKVDATNFLQSLGSFFAKLIDLQEGIDKEGTVIYIKKNIRVNGANAWLLMCSITIASLGLDMNSPAIIIGAMLISPLMSPILGVGLGIGTNDRETLIISLKHFGISIAIALITSFVYFAINPLGHVTPTFEIMERTQPTLLAGLVAIFGGIAGIISITRKDGSIAMPGVAIATALMPPLCVSGYGLASGNWDIFVNSFYLFFLNSFFIAVSAFVMIKYMKFTSKEYQNLREQRKTNFIIGLISLALIMPSILILRDVVTKNTREQIVSKFVGEYFGEDDDPVCLSYTFNQSDTSQVLAIKLLGARLSQKTIQKYENLLLDAGIPNIRILALQDEKPDLEHLKEQLTGYNQVINRLVESEDKKSEAEQTIDSLTSVIIRMGSDTIPIYGINKEIKIMLDPIQRMSYGYVHSPQDSGTTRSLHLFVEWQDNVPDQEKIACKTKLQNFMQARLPGQQVVVVDL